MSAERTLIFYIGTRKILVLWGEVQDGAARVLGFAETEHPEGFERGCVTNIEKASDALQTLLDGMSSSGQFAGEYDFSDESVYVVLGNSKLKTFTFNSSQYYQGVRRNVTLHDVRSVIQQTRSVATLPLSEYVLETIPVSFLVNDLENVTDPVGLEAERLGVTLKIYTMDFQEFRNINKVFEAAEIEVKGFFSRVLASSEAVLTEREKTEGTLLLDIGYDVTYLVLWRRGELVSTKALDFGVHELTKQVAKEWQIDLHDAAKVVEQYGSLHAELEFGDELIPLVKRGTNEKRQVERESFHKHFLAITKDWMTRILKETDEFIRKENIYYPHYVLTGGGTAMDGFIEFIQKEFSRESRLGYARLKDVPHKLKVNPFATPALGMLGWLAGEVRDRKTYFESRNLLHKTFVSAREWFSAYF